MKQARRLDDDIPTFGEVARAAIGGIVLVVIAYAFLVWLLTL